MRNVLVLLLCISFSVCAFSCKKKGGAAPFSDVRIATVDFYHSGEIEHYHIVYDQYYNVDSIVRTGDGTALGNNGYKKFTYFGSSYSITDESNFSFTVQANTSGQILKILTADTLIMHYNGSQLGALDTKTALPSYPYYKVTTVYYTWTNGDVTGVGPAGGTDNIYGYDLSKSGQPGELFRIADFLVYGRSYIKNTHLAKYLITGSDTVEKYYYQFEATGRLSQLLKINNSSGSDDSTFYNYKYY